MAGQSGHEQKVSLLKQEVDFLKDQLNVLKAQQELNLARQTQDAQAAKALLDANRSTLDSQYAEAVARTQLPFAELQGMKLGLNSQSMPKGKEGTISVDGGKPGTLFLASRRPQLELLSRITDDLVKACQTNETSPKDTIVLTEAKLRQSLVATFTSSWVKRAGDRLWSAARLLAESVPPRQPDATAETSPALAAMPLPDINAAAYGIGLTLDTINGLFKLLRTDREMFIFDVDAEAFQVLNYLLEMRQFVSAANPAIHQGEMLSQADGLLQDLEGLRTSVEAGRRALDMANTMPHCSSEMQMDDLKSAIDEAMLLIDSLHPSKSPEAFWAQVEGEVIARQLDKKSRLIVELKAQVVQEKTSNWFLGDRVSSSAEMLLSYRLLDVNNIQKKADVILRSSQRNDLRCDDDMEMSTYFQAERTEK